MDIELGLAQECPVEAVGRQGETSVQTDDANLGQEGSM